MQAMELVVAGLLIAVGAVVMWGSADVGIGWASDGPRAGYFPFYVGLLIVGSSLVTFVRAAVSADRTVFVSGARFKPVLIVLVPSLIYVGLIGVIGIYVASAAFIAFFMLTVGGERGLRVPAVSFGVPIAVFFVFERWFLVPLPKGPLESLLGL